MTTCLLIRRREPQRPARPAVQAPLSCFSVVFLSANARAPAHPKLPYFCRPLPRSFRILASVICFLITPPLLAGKRGAQRPAHLPSAILFSSAVFLSANARALAHPELPYLCRPLPRSFRILASVICFLITTLLRSGEPRGPRARRPLSCFLPPFSYLRLLMLLRAQSFPIFAGLLRETSASQLPSSCCPDGRTSQENQIS